MIDTLLVIPARGGSKGVPGKNVRLLNGKPLIAYAIEACQQVDRAFAVVSTDDDEIAMVARRYGVDVIRRPADLAGDDVPLDPVLHHALTSVGTFSIAATVQPTSPFLTSGTIATVLDAVRDGAETALTVADARGLHWTGSPTTPFKPPHMVNRQQIAATWQQTGGCVASQADLVTPSNRYGQRCRLIPVEGPEAVDIDTEHDWQIAQSIANRKRIAYRVDGGGTHGMGHVYRALMLARTPDHDVTLYMDRRAYPAGVDLAESRGATVRPVSDLMADQPDVLIIEGFDTTVSDVQAYQSSGVMVVTIEDRGDGSDVADLTINDLDGPPLHGPQRYQGPLYACLRDEFASVVPKPLAAQVGRILVTFGGADPARLTRKAIDALDGYDGVTVIQGPDADPVTDDRVTVVESPALMSQYMVDADLVVTSAGRTVLELIRCQTPTVAFAQNAHEMKHASADWRYGVHHGGYGPTATVDQMRDAIEHLKPYARRQASRDRMAAVAITDGGRVIWDLIWQRYQTRDRITAPALRVVA